MKKNYLAFMEIKVIFYIVGGILYFLYTIGKKAQEKQKAAASTTNENGETTVPKTVTPPAANPLKDILREIEKKQAQMEAQKKASMPKPKPDQAWQQKKPEKELFIKEKKKATFGEGAADAPVYEDEVVEKEKTKRGDIRLKNEGIYQVQTMEEARAQADEAESPLYEFDAKQAFIGSVIFERKY